MFFKKNKNKIEKVKKQYVKFCPRCKSLNVKVSNTGGSAGTYFGLPTLYKCLNCGYSNYAFPEIDLNELKNQEEQKKEKENKENDID
jgi:DNA-directed RNA polymerase subunit M/transcription elongation factor TFIIS